MFDFLKRMFHGKKTHSARSQDVACLDVVVGNDIEILKTSDYVKGAPTDAIEQLVADIELPPAQLDLPMVEMQLPAAQLDQPSDEPYLPLEFAPPLMPEVQSAEMNTDQINLQRFIDRTLKGKMVSEYVNRSMTLIRDKNNNEHITRLGFDKPCQFKEDENNQSYARWLMSVAEEGTASTDILWLLVDDPNPDVRFCLAETYDIDTDILTLLSEDENPYVAHRAHKTLTRLQSPAGEVVDHDFGFDEINRLRKRG